jgi:hypothetical protein
LLAAGADCDALGAKRFPFGAAMICTSSSQNPQLFGLFDLEIDSNFQA